MYAPPRARTQCQVSWVLWSEKAAFCCRHVNSVAVPKPLSIPFQFSSRKTQWFALGRLQHRPVWKGSLIECAITRNRKAAYVTHTFLKWRIKSIHIFTRFLIIILRWLAVLYLYYKSLVDFAGVWNKVTIVLCLTKKGKCASFGYL